MRCVESDIKTNSKSEKKDIKEKTTVPEIIIQCEIAIIMFTDDRPENGKRDTFGLWNRTDECSEWF